MSRLAHLTAREADLQRLLDGTLSRGLRSDLTAELFEIAEILDRRARRQKARRAL